MTTFNKNDSDNIKTEQLNLQFTIDQNTAFQLIEGSSIYNTKLIFIRELLQNAMDATKIQIWKDIKSGKHDNCEEMGCVNRILSKETPKFYDEVPENIKDFYPIKINFSLDDVNNTKYKDSESPYECLVIDYNPTWNDYIDFCDYAKYSIASPLSKPLDGASKYNGDELKYWIKTNCNFDKLVD